MTTIEKMRRYAKRQRDARFAEELTRNALEFGGMWIGNPDTGAMGCISAREPR